MQNIDIGRSPIAKTLFVKTNCCILITVHIPKLNVWWSMNWLWKWKSTVEKLWNAILIDDDVYTLSLLDLEFQQMYQLKKGFYKSYYIYIQVIIQVNFYYSWNNHIISHYLIFVFCVYCFQGRKGWVCSTSYIVCLDSDPGKKDKFIYANPKVVLLKSSKNQFLGNFPNFRTENWTKRSQIPAKKFEEWCLIMHYIL